MEKRILTLVVGFFIYVSALSQCPVPTGMNGWNACANPTQQVILRAQTIDQTCSQTISHKWYYTATGSEFALGTQEYSGSCAVYQSKMEIAESRTFWVAAVINGCESARVKVVGTVSKNIPPRLTVSPSLFDNGTEFSGAVICSDQGTATVTLRASGGYEGPHPFPASVYEWYNAPISGELLATGQQLTRTITPSQTMNGIEVFYVGGMLTNSLGCTYPISPRRPVYVKLVDYPECLNYTEHFTVQNNTFVEYNAVLSAALPAVLKSTNYFDALGRPIQQVQKQASPGSFDVVQPIVYDAFGRQDRKYLPAVAVGQASGSFKPGILDNSGTYSGAAHNFYSTSGDRIADDSHPYSKTLFETSPLNRIARQGSPGADWQPSPFGAITNLSQSWNYKEFLANSGASGAGGVTLNIANNQLIVSFSAGFNSTLLRTGNVAPINSTPALPDVELGLISMGNYRASIKNNHLFIESVTSSPVSVTGFGTTSYGAARTFTIDLSDHSVKYSYLINSANEVLRWTFDSPTGLAAAGTVSSPIYYPPNTLTVKKTIDENGAIMLEYYDNEGQNILKRVQAGANSSPINDTNFASTYYIYDDLGRLACVLPPEASRLVPTFYFQAGATSSTKEQFLNKWAFRYKYDSKHRIIQKRVPGAEWLYMVYDDRDRLVMTQDGNQRIDETGAVVLKDWTFRKFDWLDREVLAGIVTMDAVLSQSEMQQRVDNFYAAGGSYYDSYIGNVAGNVHGYSNTSFPQVSEPNAYSNITYYDRYDFKYTWRENFSYSTDGLVEVSNGEHVQRSAESFAVRGQVTGQKVKELDGSPLTASTWLRTVSYYDEKYRLIQAKAENYKGGIDKTSTLFDFVGKPLRTRTTYQEFHLNWKELKKVDAFGSKYEKSGATAWDAAMFSDEFIPANTDGWIEWTADDTRYKIIGLNEVNQSNYLSMDCGIYLQNGPAYVREQNVNVKTITSNYKPGDIFKIERTGNTVSYYYNGAMVHSKSVSTRPALYVDITLNDSEAFISDIRTSFSHSSWRIDRRMQYDHAGRILKSFHQIGDGQRAQWANLTGVTVSSGDLIKNNGQGWNAGASSVQSIPAGKDGWMEFLAQLNHARMVGLADGNLASAGYNTIDYCFYLHGDNVNIRENGVDMGFVSKFDSDDVFRIERQGGVVYYKKNGRILYISTVPSTTELFIDCSLYHVGAELVNAFIGSGIGSAEVTIATNEYNEIGQLVDKKLHSVGGTTEKQSVDYRYNIRGWLTSINNAALIDDQILNNDSGDLFGMQLSYNNVDSDLANSVQYNGNISGIKWSNYGGVGDITQKGYSYGYDVMNRISSSTFRKKNSSWSPLPNSGFAETGFQYDLNGNIERLTRNDGRASGTMDILVYDYGTGANKSNRLLSITDNGDDFSGFVDGSNGAVDYYYDANGNLMRDLNKGIGNNATDNTNRITYNSVNLPMTVTKGGNTIRYIYDAAGRKLAQFVYSGGAVKRSDYLNELMFEDDQLRFVNHEEGRVVISSDELIYLNDGADHTAAIPDNASIAAHTANGEQYVKVTYTGSTPHSKAGMRSIGGQFVVKAGERYQIKVKGYRTTNPVYVWVKANGVDLVWKGVALPEGALNDAFVEQTVIISADGSMEVALVWDMSMTNGESFYVNAFEIIKVSEQAPEYQYHLKDHLGNVRLTFSTKEDVETFGTTFESETQALDQSTFSNYSTVTNDLFDKTDAGAEHNKAHLLRGGNNSQVGVGKSLAVMPGDQISAVVYARYVKAKDSPGNLTGLASAVLSGPPLSGEGATALVPLNEYGNLITPNDKSDDEGSSGWLNILVFDKNYKTVDMAAQKLEGQQYAHTIGSAEKGPHMMLSRKVTIKEPGYVYVYVSNEGAVAQEVYFDNLTITITRNPIVQTNDYYPFGLTFNSYQRENSIKQDYRYNGKELQDELDLAFLDYGARMYKPDIARWTAIDPMSDRGVALSPYGYAVNNPILFVDPDGMWVEGGDAWNSMNEKFDAERQEKRERKEAESRPVHVDNEGNKVYSKDVAYRFTEEDYYGEYYSQDVSDIDVDANYNKNRANDKYSGQINSYNARFVLTENGFGRWRNSNGDELGWIRAETTSHHRIQFNMSLLPIIDARDADGLKAYMPKKGSKLNQFLLKPAQGIVHLQTIPFGEGWIHSWTETRDIGRRRLENAGYLKVRNAVNEFHNINNSVYSWYIRLIGGWTDQSGGGSVPSFRMRKIKRLR